MVGPVRFGSLFSGIGGIDLGLERAGMVCRWQVENNEWCSRVLEKHWPDVARYGDIYNVDTSALESVDLIAGGFPCQPVSLARGGNIEGTADARWLWPQFHRFISEIRPDIVLVENVPGIYLRGGSEVLADLAEIGYDAEWDVISAEAVGAPHLRERFILVAYPGRQHGPKRLEVRRGLFRRGSVSHLVERSGEVDTPRTEVADAYSEGLQGCWREHQLPASSGEGETCWCGWWAIEPNVGRVVDGVPDRVDRLRGLGNAVVPQLAEWVGRLIYERVYPSAEA